MISFKNRLLQMIPPGTRAGVFLTAFFVLLVMGCSGERSTMAPGKAASLKIAEPIVVQPVVDERSDRSFPFDRDEAQKLESLVMERLQKLGYGVISASSQEGEAIGASDKGSALTIRVDNIYSSYKVLMSSFSITATLSLVSLPGQEEIWKKSDTGDSLGFGPIGTQISHMTKASDGYQDFVTRALASFPEKI